MLHQSAILRMHVIDHVPAHKRLRIRHTQQGGRRPVRVDDQPLDLHVDRIRRGFDERPVTLLAFAQGALSPSVLPQIRQGD